MIVQPTCTYTRSHLHALGYNTCAMIRSCCAAGCTLGWLGFAFGCRSVVAPPRLFCVAMAGLRRNGDRQELCIAATSYDPSLFDATPSSPMKERTTPHKDSSNTARR